MVVSKDPLVFLKFLPKEVAERRFSLRVLCIDDFDLKRAGRWWKNRMRNYRKRLEEIGLEEYADFFDSYAKERHRIYASMRMNVMGQIKYLIEQEPVWAEWGSKIFLMEWEEGGRKKKSQAKPWLPFAYMVAFTITPIRFPNVSAFWTYCGDGKRDRYYKKREDGTIVLYKGELKEAATQIARLLVNLNPIYARIFKEQYSKALNEGLTESHAKARAIAAVRKIFEAHFFEMFYIFDCKLMGIKPSESAIKPFAVEWLCHPWLRARDVIVQK